eukprot:COSAG04_NODE_1843_length_5419_cov_7.115226_5_plen_122_part_00
MGGVHGPVKGAGLYLTVCESIQPTRAAVDAANATMPTELRATAENKVANEDAALAAHVVRRMLARPGEGLPTYLGVDEEKLVAERASVLEQRTQPRLFSAPGVFLKDDGALDGYMVQRVVS